MVQIPAPSPFAAPPPVVTSSATGGNLDDLRRRNLASVLRLAHVSGGLTRAEITRETGLNRSTVGALVADLAAAELVSEESAVRSGGVGRPSPLVVPTDQVKVLAINPEIDATAGALVGLGGKVFARGVVVHETVPTAQDVVAAIGHLSSELSQSLGPTEQIQGIGLAVPGLVWANTGVVAVAPHLRWRDEPLQAMVAAQHHTTVVVDNDANCGAIAESLFGAGKGLGTVVYLNGGASGIGGGIVSGGALAAGINGFGGEFGHTLVNSKGADCHCGGRGCLETEVRRSALLALVPGEDVSSLDEQLVIQCEAENKVVIAEVDRQLTFLGAALRTVVHVINPQRIILGGFLASLVRARGSEILDAAVRCTMPGNQDLVQIHTAALGHDILAVGAAELVIREVISHPLR